MREKTVGDYKRAAGRNNYIARANALMGFLRKRGKVSFLEASAETGLAPKTIRYEYIMQMQPDFPGLRMNKTHIWIEPEYMPVKESVPVGVPA